MRDVVGVMLSVAFLLAGTATAQEGTRPKTTIEERLEALEKELAELKRQRKKELAELRKQREDDLAELRTQKGKEIDPNNLRAYWDKGLRLETADKNFKLKMGGRLMYDLGWISQSGGHLETYGDIGDYGEARRARFYTSGTIYGNTFFKLEVDFAGGDADLKDAYVGVKDLPYVHMVQVGHITEPFSLEELTSNKYITFIERSLPNALVPGRSAGVMIGAVPSATRG